MQVQGPLGVNATPELVTEATDSAFNHIILINVRTGEHLQCVVEACYTLEGTLFPESKSPWGPRTWSPT